MPGFAAIAVFAAFTGFAAGRFFAAFLIATGPDRIDEPAGSCEG